MRSFIYEIVFVLCLPSHVFNFGVKFEGIVNLGPKWDYIYKLIPTDANVVNSNELLRSNYRNTNKNYKKEDTAEVSKANDKNLEIDSYRTSTDKPYPNKEIQGDKNDLEEQHDLIYKEILKHDELRDVLNNNTKKSKVKRRKTTKRFELHNRNVDKDFNRDQHYNADDDDMETKIVTDEKSNPKDEEQFNKHKNRNTKKDSLRNKKNYDNTLKDNPKTKDFIFHIFMQSLKIFDKVKNMAAVDELKRKISLLKNSYIEDFSNYLNETDGHKLKTKLANQNVVLNTLDTSNYFLKRLVNHLKMNEDGYNVERSSDIIKMFDKEIQRENDIEHKHACNKLAVCRTNNEFTDFISDLLHIILQTNNYKIKQAANALTEVVKTTDLTDVIDYETENKLRKLMDKIETWEPFLIRSMFLMFRTALMRRNQPIVIMDKSDANLANRTVTFYDLIDVLNKIMGTVENKSEWIDMKKKMEDWKDGKGNDVQNVLERLIRQIMNEVDKLDLDQKENVRFIMKTLLNSR